MNFNSDILFIDKPKGITSYDVIRNLKRAFKRERPNTELPKFGHAGTLDPLATGLMVIGVGSGTKELKEYIGLPKEYIADVLVGEKRSTGDMEGEVLDRVRVDTLDEEQVRALLHEMVGILRLPVSAYSAVKKGGIPMYKRARKAEKEGKKVLDVPIRDMEVMEAELLTIKCKDQSCILTIRFFVGSGTYIRSLAEELGNRLGYPATLYDLKRTQVGDFRIEDAEKLAEGDI